MARLKSTKGIFHGKLQITHTLMLRTDALISREYHSLDRLRAAILRAKGPETLVHIRKRLEDMANDMGHTPPSSADRNKLLKKISIYKKQNDLLRFASIQQGLINMCVIYEELIRRIIMKHYEENIHRIPKKQSTSNRLLIEAILRGDNMHYTLAEKTVDDIMYGSPESWHDTLNSFGMNIVTDQKVKELFLIRNCMVHNRKRVSAPLHMANPTEYPLRSDIRLTMDDVEDFKDHLHKQATFIIAEYDRVNPKNQGSWIGFN